MSSVTSDFKYLSPDDVIKIHDVMIQRYGGETGIFSEGRGKIESMIDRMQTGYFSQGEPTYQTLIEEVAFLFQSILQYHPFVDGMKRTGIMSAFAFLLKNDYIFVSFKDLESINFAKRVAKELALGDPEDGFKEIVGWFSERTVSLWDKDKFFDISDRIQKFFTCPRCKNNEITLSHSYCRDCGLQLTGRNIIFDGIVLRRVIRIERQPTEDLKLMVYSKNRLEWTLKEIQ